MNRILFLALLATVLSGCASSGRIGDLPAISPGASSSKLVLLRVSSHTSGLNSFYVALDGRDVFSIRSGEYTEFPIPVGEHFISVKCFGGWSPTWKEDTKRFNALPDMANYFEIRPNGLACAYIWPIGEEDAKKQMNRSKFISPETPSTKN